MKRDILFLSTALALTAPSVAETKPNILIIYSDDQGFGDFSAQNPESAAVSKVPDWFNEKFNFPENPHPGALYKFAQDLAQRHNLWADQPERVAEMKKMLSRIRKSGQVR